MSWKTSYLPHSPTFPHTFHTWPQYCSGDGRVLEDLVQALVILLSIGGWGGEGEAAALRGEARERGMERRDR